jgi:hypothetical protein
MRQYSAVAPRVLLMMRSVERDGRHSLCHACAIRCRSDLVDAVAVIDAARDSPTTKMDLLVVLAIGILLVDIARLVVEANTR